MIVNRQPSSMVRNAADPQQTKRAARIERRREERDAADLVAGMQTSEGRRMLWTRIKKCGVFQSVWEPSAKIHYNAGRQDVGHELLADVINASPDLYSLMEREARELQRREHMEIEAGHTTTAATDEDAPNG